MSKCLLHFKFLPAIFTSSVFNYHATKMHSSIFCGFMFFTLILLPLTSLQGPFKHIPLHGTSIEECNLKGMKYVFRLRPCKGNRDYLLQAADESEEQLWMQAICFAKVTATGQEPSSLCLLQWRTAVATNKCNPICLTFGVNFYGTFVR